MSTPSPTISHDVDTTPQPPLSTPWRLGLDMGAGSIGWAVLDLRAKAGPDGEPTTWEPFRLRDLGVTIFDSGQDERGQSANTERRRFRAARRRLRSLKRRKRRLLRHLIELGCIAASEQARLRARDRIITLPHGTSGVPAVWALRWIALRRRGELEKAQLGTVLMALATSRGQAFSADSESEQRLPKATELQQKISSAGAIAFGDYAAELLSHQPGATVRARNGVDHYLSRDMVIAEFDAIRKAQTSLLTAEEWSELREIIFDRPTLKPPVPGPCPLIPGEKRIARAHPDFQAFRIMQTLRNIELRTKKGQEIDDRDPRLTEDEIRRAREFLRGQRHVSPSALFKAIGLQKYGSNYHQDEVPISGDETGTLLGATEAFGKRWFTLRDDDRVAMVERALAYRDSGKVPPYGVLATEWGLPDEAHVRAIFNRLPRGRGRYGPTATAQLLREMVAGKTLHDAREIVYPGRVSEKCLHRLPHYGAVLTEDVFDPDPQGASDEERFGRVRNPVVHVALNQLRGLVNALCAEFGKPQEIVIELARSMRLPESKKREIDRRSRERKKLRDAAAQCIREINWKASNSSIERYLLWEELGAIGERLCPYSLRPIGDLTQLLTECEVDHIVPRSRCGDDSLANKTVVFRNANRAKKEQTPFEAFGSLQSYDAILKNAKRNWGDKKSLWYNPRKYRRFTSGAVDEFCGKFANRELNDTAYASRLAREYLTALGVRVHATRGTITGRLRKAWDLAKLLPLPPALTKKLESARAEHQEIPDEVKRHDHRHHAIDAALIGLVDPHELAAYFQKTEEQARKDLPPPWPTFTTELGTLLDRFVGDRPDRVIRHRPRHKRGFEYAGELLQASRYRRVIRNGQTFLLKRLPLREIAIDRNGNLTVTAKPRDAAWLSKQWKEVRDGALRELLDSVFSPKAFEQAVAAVEAEQRELQPDAGARERRNARRRAEGAAWDKLCRDFAAQNGGRVSIAIERTWNDPIVVPDRKYDRDHAFVSGGNACADILLRPGKRGKTYASRVVPLIDAVRRTAQASSEKGLVAKIHQGDMLKIISDGKVRYVVVRAIMESGKLRLALHNNANAGKVTDKSYRLDSIEGDKEANVAFGSWRARVVRPTPLGVLKDHPP